MNRTRVVTAVLISFLFVFPTVVSAASVDKCFKKVEKATASITKNLSGWSMAVYAKKSKKLGTTLEKGWKKTAGCLAKQYKPKGAKKSDLKTALMRGNKVYKATGGEDWMGQGLINKCIPMALDAYNGTEDAMNGKAFKKLSKKEQKKEKKRLIKNQKKVIRGTVGYCFKKETERYKNRLEDYLKDYYEEM